MSQTTIFEALREDHDRQRELIAAMVETSGDSKKRNQLFEKLKNELEAHAAAEEKTLYASMMKKDNTIEKARHSVAEHKELDDIIEKLEETDMSSPSWIATAKELKHRLGHHLDEEEQEVFKSAGHALEESTKLNLSKRYSEEMEARL